MTAAFTRNDPVNPPKPLFDCLEQAIRCAIHAGTNIREVNFTRWAETYETTAGRVEEMWARCLTRVAPNSIEAEGK
jgi:hypothetical protein